MFLHIRTVNNSGEQHPIFDFFFPDLAQSSHVTIIDIFCQTVKSLRIAAFFMLSVIYISSQATCDM